MKNQVFQKISLFYESDKLIWIIISLGAILRLIQYLSNRSLWFDESMLALNIIDRSFLELLQPLNYNQGAPIGFLFIEKIISKLLNNSEFALRLFPFLTGIISLYLFYKVANQFIKPKAVPIALSLFAFSKPLIYYSTEMKQYSSDVFAALLLFYLAAKIIQSNQLSVSFAILFGVIGSIIIWLSHPSIFIVAGVGVSLALFFLINKEWIKIARLTIAYFFWVINFIAIYFLFLRNLCNNDLLINYWSDAFLPNLQLSTLNIKWLIISFFDILKNQVGLYFNGIAGLAFLIGSISMLSGNNKIFYVLMLPVLLVLIASGFRLYPFNGRLLLFIVPSFVLIISEGSEYIREKTKNNATIIWFIIICLLFLPQVGKAILIPYYKEEIRSVVNYISENEKNGDKLYLYYGSIPAYKYYSAILNINNKSYIEGKEGRDNWRIYIDDINKLRGNKRVWILFSHVGKGEGVDEEIFFIYYLNIIGDNLEKFKSPGASVYLYNLYK